MRHAKEENYIKVGLPVRPVNSLNAVNKRQNVTLQIRVSWTGGILYPRIVRGNIHMFSHRPLVGFHNVSYRLIVRR
jgi:hypothetical protein